MRISGGRTEQLIIIASFLPRHWLYEWFSQFHSCGTYSVLSRSPSILYGQSVFVKTKAVIHACNSWYSCLAVVELRLMCSLFSLSRYHPSTERLYIYISNGRLHLLLYYWHDGNYSAFSPTTALPSSLYRQCHLNNTHFYYYYYYRHHGITTEFSL